MRAHGAHTFRKTRVKKYPFVKSKSFFFFLLDPNVSREQKHYLLLNLSKLQVQAITEVLYNITKNRYIKLSPSLQKKLKRNEKLIKKLLSQPQTRLLEKRRLIRKHNHLIYQIISDAKDIIFQALKT